MVTLWLYCGYNVVKMWVQRVISAPMLPDPYRWEHCKYTYMDMVITWLYGYILWLHCSYIVVTLHYNMVIWLYIMATL